MNKLSFLVITTLIACIAGCGDDPRLAEYGEEISKLKGQNDQAKSALTKIQEENLQAKTQQEKLQKENEQAQQTQAKLQKDLDVLAKSSRLIRQPIQEKSFDDFLNSSTATAKNQPKNVIFFFIDSLRNDYVNMTTAPTMKKFIDNNWNFEHPYSSSTITHKSTFSMFYSQPAFLRQPFIALDWKKGSPFLRSMKKLGYNIKLYGSPWQYCRDNVAQKENSASRTSGVSNLRLLYGEKPRDLLSQCYKFYDFDDTQYKQYGRRDPEGFTQDFPYIGPKAKSWKKYQGDLNLNETSGTPYEYYHQGYLDYKIVSDTIDEIQNDNLPGNSSKNFYFVYLFGVHSAQAWPDKGIPDSIVAPTSWSITPDFAPFHARLKPIPNIADGNPGATIPSLHTPVYWELGDLVKKALTPSGGVSDPKYVNLRSELKDLYHNSVVGADYEFYRLLNSLTPEQYNNSLIVLVSDHGFLMFEKDHPIGGDLSEKFMHFGPPVKENTQVPIAIKFPQSTDPKIALSKKKHIGSHVDIFPTVVDYVSSDFYSELKDKKLVAGSSILSHDRSCAVTVLPTNTFVDTTVVFNNGRFKAWVDFDKRFAGIGLGTTGYLVRMFLDLNDQETTYPTVGGNKASENGVFINLAILTQEFGECLDEIFPRTDIATALSSDKQQLNFDIEKSTEQFNKIISHLDTNTYAGKLDFLKIFRGEQVRDLIFARYYTLSPAEQTTMLDYVNTLVDTLGTPANPNNDPLLDFEPVPPLDMPNLATCGVIEAGGAGSDNDMLRQRKAIESIHKNILIKPGEQHFYYNDHYFENHNYNNLPKVYLDQLKNTPRFHGFAFVGNAGGKSDAEAQAGHLRILENGLGAGVSQASGSANNIDLYRYFKGFETGTLGGFRSFSRSTLVAKHFAAQYNKSAPKNHTHAGYVYATYIEGGFNILGVDNWSVWPSNNPTQPIKSYAYEQEVAVRGYTPARNIVAFRKVHMGSNKFDNTTQVFVRKGFKTMDPAAYQKVVKALAGCSNYSN